MAAIAICQRTLKVYTNNQNVLVIQHDLLNCEDVTKNRQIESTAILLFNNTLIFILPNKKASRN